MSVAAVGAGVALISMSRCRLHDASLAFHDEARLNAVWQVFGVRSKTVQKLWFVQCAQMRDLAWPNPQNGHDCS
jgi:hypothetical protein